MKRRPNLMADGNTRLHAKLVGKPLRGLDFQSDKPVTLSFRPRFFIRQLIADLDTLNLL